MQAAIDIHNFALQGHDEQWVALKEWVCTRALQLVPADGAALVWASNAALEVRMSRCVLEPSTCVHIVAMSVHLI